MAEQPTTEQPYTDATVRLVVDAVNATALRDWETWPTIAAQDDALARATLDALAATGRLLPEGAHHQERFVVQLTDRNGCRVSTDLARDLDHAQSVARGREAAGWSVRIEHRHVWHTNFAPVPINEESADA